MIQLSDDEKRRLEKEFEHVPDRDLIRELLRRGRFRQYESNAVYFKELKGDDRYMDMIRSKLLYTVAHQLDADKDARPAMITEHPEAHDPLYRKTVMTADIIVLNQRPVQAVRPGE